MKTTLDNYLESIVDSYTKLYKAAAYWTSLRYKVLRKGDIEETRRITLGDQVTIIENTLCSCNDSQPTHEIKGIQCTLQGTQCEFECINLSTGLTETIKLK